MNLSDIEVSFDESAKWTKLAAAKNFDTIVAQIEDAGELTEAAVLRAIKTGNVGANSAVDGGAGNEWYTPAEVIEAASECLGGIDLDPASCATANAVVKAETFWGWRIPAPEMERVVVAAAKAFLDDRPAVLAALQESEIEIPDVREVLKLASELSRRLSSKAEEAAT